MADEIQKENSHSGHRARLKQRFLAEGLDSFNDYQILELLLFYTIPLKDTNEIAHELIKTFGSLSRVLDAHPSELQKVKGISEHSSAMLSMLPQVFRAYSKDIMRERPVLGNTETAKNYIKNFFMGRLYEVFYLFCMNKSYRVIHEELLCEGSLDEAPCYPRLVLESAFRHNAQKVIFAHNHPSNIMRPSTSDIKSTQKLVKLFESLDIEVVDHIIVGKTDCVSMAELGLLK